MNGNYDGIEGMSYHNDFDLWFKLWDIIECIPVQTIVEMFK